MRDFLRDLKNRVLRSPFKVLILLGSWDFWYLTSTFDSHHPLFFMPENGELSGIFLVFKTINYKMRYISYKGCLEKGVLSHD